MNWVWMCFDQIIVFATNLTVSDLADEAFTAGLLHDAGRWVMLANLGEDYAKLLQDAAVDASPLAAFEERVNEPLVSYEAVLKELKADGRL